jgi:hypothetical protein
MGGAQASGVNVGRNYKLTSPSFSLTATSASGAVSSASGSGAGGAANSTGAERGGNRKSAIPACGAGGGGNSSDSGERAAAASGRQAAGAASPCDGSSGAGGGGAAPGAAGAFADVLGFAAGRRSATSRGQTVRCGFSGRVPAWQMGQAIRNILGGG